MRINIQKLCTKPPDIYHTWRRSLLEFDFQRKKRESGFAGINNLSCVPLTLTKPLDIWGLDFLQKGGEMVWSRIKFERLSSVSLAVKKPPNMRRQLAEFYQKGESISNTNIYCYTAADGDHWPTTIYVPHLDSEQRTTSSNHIGPSWTILDHLGQSWTS